MSMQVDTSTPLTQEERAYLLMRGRDAEVFQIDERYGATDADYSGDGTGPKSRTLLTGEQVAGRREQLLAELEMLDKHYGDPESVEDDGSEVAPYEDWTHKELDTELKRRSLSGGGSKEEKAQRLYADDAEQEQPPA